MEKRSPRRAVLVPVQDTFARLLSWANASQQPQCSQASSLSPLLPLIWLHSTQWPYWTHSKSIHSPTNQTVSQVSKSALGRSRNAQLGTNRKGIQGNPNGIFRSTAILIEKTLTWHLALIKFPDLERSTWKWETVGKILVPVLQHRLLAAVC